MSSSYSMAQSSIPASMTDGSHTSASGLALELVVSLSSLEIDDLVRLTLQKPDITRIFATALHTLAVAKAALALPIPSTGTGNDVYALAMLSILSRLIERGDPSLARKFVPTHGSLVDLCVVAHGLASKQAKDILDRLVDASAVEVILRSLLDQLNESVSVNLSTVSSAKGVQISSRLVLAFLDSCASRPLLSLGHVLTTCLENIFEIYDTKLKAKDQRMQLDLNLLAEQNVHLHWLATKVDLMQICSILLSILRPLPLAPIISQLDRSSLLLQEANFEPMICSTILVDLSNTGSWIAATRSLSAMQLPAKSVRALASIDALASQRPPFSGAAWDALRALTPGQEQSQAASFQLNKEVSEELLATVDSILPHYGLAKLRVILCRDTFQGQEVETIIQRLLEGDEGNAGSSGSSDAHTGIGTMEAAYQPESDPLPPPSHIRSRANLFGDSAYPSLVQSKPRTSKIEELAPELKAAILARAEAADEEEDAGEEWNPFAEAQSTVGVEDELDLDFEGREKRSLFPSRDGDEDGTDDEEDPSRARERTLIRHYIQSGSTSFSSDQGIRQSKDRKKLKDATGWSDDLIESWGVMFERNPMKDRLLAAATGAELDRSLSSRSQLDDDEDDDRPKWGADRGRGGRILGGRGGSRAQGGRGGAPKATRGKGTGNSANDRSAKQKEKQGNKARQRGHDKKMSRVNP